LSGCIDIIVVRQPDGTLKASPFHVRFGKLKLLKSKRKTVVICVNGKENAEVGMILGEAGEAFFVRQELVIPDEEFKQPPG
jgi:phosphatidate phosphatase LPIN